jgi:hypothetical protein
VQVERDERKRGQRRPACRNAVEREREERRDSEAGDRQQAFGDARVPQPGKHFPERFVQRRVGAEREDGDEHAEPEQGGEPAVALPDDEQSDQRRDRHEPAQEDEALEAVARVPRDLLDLEEVERRLRPMTRRYLGVRAIPIAHVVWTDSRGGAFTRRFEPRHGFGRDRLRSLESAFPDGGFPPIVAVKLGETYFVIDGHHRVALARRHGAAMIDADVTEFVTRVPLPAGADMLDVVLRELERVFLEDSGLAEARPGVRLSASRPALYLEILENLQVHGYHLMLKHYRVLGKA